MKLFKMLDELSSPFTQDVNRSASATQQRVQAGYFNQAGAHSGGAGAAGFSSSQPNIFGGFNYNSGGQQVGYSMPNVFGGFDYHG